MIATNLGSGYAWSMDTTNLEGISRSFAAVVRDFIGFADEAHRLDLRVRVLTARRHLSALLVAADSLPHHSGLAVSSEAAENAARSRPASWEAFGDHECYWEVFDPYELDEPVAGSLSDDLLDVYSDLARGMALHDRGEYLEALWDWDFHFQFHWGDHAVDALRALQRAANRAADG